MKNKILTFLILGLFLISFTSALDSLGTFEKNENVNISQVCSDATWINISSISYPNSSKAVSNIEMIAVGSGEFYYDFNLTSVLGRYEVRGISDSCEKTFATYFTITPNGKDFDSGQVLGGIGIIVVILATAFIFVILGFKLGENEKTMPIGFFFIVMAVILVIYSLHLGWIFSVDILQHEVLSSGVSTIFVVILWSCAGISIIFIALMLIAFIRELGKMNDKKKFGEDFNPLTGTYE